MESAELLKHIRRELQRKIEIPTPEWKTSRQWAVEWNLKQSQTNRFLNLAVEEGIMEVKTFRVPCPTRTSYPCPHYRSVTATPSDPASSSKSLPQMPSSESAKTAGFR